MLRPKIYWTKSQRNLAKFQNFEKFNIIQICTDVTVLLHSIWELLTKPLFAFTFDYMYFFQFLPLSSSFFQFLLEETGRNIFFPVSSILPGRNIIPEVSEPCILVCAKEYLELHFNQTRYWQNTLYQIFTKLPHISHIHKNCTSLA